MLTCGVILKSHCRGRPVRLDKQGLDRRWRLIPDNVRLQTNKEEHKFPSHENESWSSLLSRNGNELNSLQCKKWELAQENDPEFHHVVSGNCERTKEDLKRGGRGTKEAKKERMLAYFKG